jgi:exodeoxyribonuclease-1
LLALDAEDIADRLYTPTPDLPEGEARIPLKEVHLNRCPALIAWAHLREADFQRLAIDPATVELRAAKLREAGPALAEKVRHVYAVERARIKADVDASLYDGFVGDGDKRRFSDVRSTPPEALGAREFGFSDPRLPELLFRYRARNWPHTLTHEEHQGWDDYRRRRVLSEAGLSELSLDRFRLELIELRALHASDGTKLALLDQLDAWSREIETSLQ